METEDDQNKDVSYLKPLSARPWKSSTLVIFLIIDYLHCIVVEWIRRFVCCASDCFDFEKN